jgi:hypothetical protein
MIAPFDVLLVEESKRTVWAFSASSLPEALEAIRKRGKGEYVVQSVETGNRRLYAVKADGETVYVGRV